MKKDVMNIKIERHDNILDAPYIAWIDGDDYRGMVVQSSSAQGCLRELAKSLDVMELRDNNR